MIFFDTLLSTHQPDLSSFRHEKKYVLSEPFSEKIELLLQQHPAIFRGIFHPRMIYNIYFDTHDLQYYRDTIDGVAQRHKVRLRWYDNAYQPQLEIKIKQFEAVKKVALPYDQLPAALLSKIPASWQKEFSRRTPGTKKPHKLQDHQTWLSLAALLKPTLYNHYQRAYFLSADESIRATIDSQVVFQTPPGIVRTRQSWESPFTILELKAPYGDSAQLNQVAQFLPFRRQHLSKYAVGISQLYSNDY